MRHVDTFTLRLADQPGALERVLALCSRKRCPVVSLAYRAGDRHRPGGLELGVRAGSRAPELEARLAGLVDVLEVHAGRAGDLELVA
jgi:acetolactate synthase regulatory subunit